MDLRFILSGLFLTVCGIFGIYSPKSLITRGLPVDDSAPQLSDFSLMLMRIIAFGIAILGIVAFLIGIGILKIE